MRLRFGMIGALLDDYAAAATPEAVTVRDALRLSSSVLARNPLLLAGQLAGRLIGDRRARVQALLTQAASEQIGPWLRPFTRSLEAPGGPLMMVFDGAGSFVRHLAVSPDGSRIAALTDQGMIFVLEAETGRTRVVFRVPVGVRRTGFALLDARRVLLVSDRGQLELWDIETSSLIVRHETGLPGTEHLVLRSGKVALTGPIGDNWVELRDVVSCERLHRFDDLRVTAIDLDFQGNALLVYDAFDGRLSLFNAEDATQRVEITDAIALRGGRAVALSSDRAFAYVGDCVGGVHVVDLRAVTKRRNLPGCESESRHPLGTIITALAAEPEGFRLLGGEAHGDIAVWDTSSGAAITVLTGQVASVCRLSFAGRHRAVSQGDDGTLRLWSLEALHPTGCGPAHSGPVLRVGVNQNGSIIWTCSRRERLRCWKVADQVRPEPLGFDLPPGEWSVLSFDATGEYSLWQPEDASDALIVRLRDGESWATSPAPPSFGKGSLAALAPLAVAVAWSPENNLLCLRWFGTDGSGHELTLVEGRTVNSAAFSGNGAVLGAALGNHSVGFWDARTGAPLGEVAWREATRHAPGSIRLGLGPDGSSALIGGDDRVYAGVDLRSMRLIDTRRIAAGDRVIGPHIVAWSGQTDCMTLVAGNAIVLERAKAAHPLVWEADAPLWSCAVSADGSTVVAGDEFGRVHVLRVCSGSSGHRS